MTIREPGYQISFKYRALLLCLIFAVLTYSARHFHLDDSLIYARYISNALHGKGLVFNPGENVNALTSILDTWLQLGLSWVLHGKVLLAQTLLGGTFFLICALIAESVVPLSGLVIAASELFYYCSGMETSLFLLCLLLCVAAYVHDRIEWLPTLCMLAILARFEGAMLVLFIAWQLWRRRRFPSIRSFVPAFLLIALYLAFNLHFYHHLLPQSAAAKFGQGRSGFWGRWPTAFLRFPDAVNRPLGTAWSFMPILTILACFGAKVPGAEKYNKILIPFFLFLAGFCILLNIPSYFWYYAPFVFFFTMYGARLLPQTRASVWATLIVVLLMTYSSRIDLKSNGAALLSFADPKPYAAAGDWIDQHAPRNARVATVETGTIAWHCHCYVIDIVGLTTPLNAEYTARHDFTSWIKERPDYIVLHPDGRFPWDRVAIASPDYQLLPMQFGSVGIMELKSDMAPTAK